RLTRDVGNIVMDVNDVEQVNLTARGGADQITVGDLSAAKVQQVNIDLAGTPGTGTGDAAVDSGLVNSTHHADNIQIAGAGSSYTVSGLSTLVSVQGSEGNQDGLFVNALGGNDTVNASGLPAGVVSLTVDGGAGNDTIIGSAGADRLVGGDG